MKKYLITILMLVSFNVFAGPVGTLVIEMDDETWYENDSCEMLTSNSTDFPEFNSGLTHEYSFDCLGSSPPKVFVEGGAQTLTVTNGISVICPLRFAGTGGDTFHVELYCQTEIFKNSFEFNEK